MSLFLHVQVFAVFFLWYWNEGMAEGPWMWLFRYCHEHRSTEAIKKAPRSARCYFSALKLSSLGIDAILIHGVFVCVTDQTGADDFEVRLLVPEHFVGQQAAFIKR